MNQFERNAAEEKQAFDRLGSPAYNNPLTQKPTVYVSVPKLPRVGNPPVKK
jgi:hypothetical protein